MKRECLRKFIPNERTNLVTVVHIYNNVRTLTHTRQQPHWQAVNNKICAMGFVYVSVYVDSFNLSSFAINNEHRQQQLEQSKKKYVAKFEQTERKKCSAP